MDMNFITLYITISMKVWKGSSDLGLIKKSHVGSVLWKIKHAWLIHWHIKILNLCINSWDRFPVSGPVIHTAILEVIRLRAFYETSAFMPVVRAGLLQSVCESRVCLQAWAAQRRCICRMGQRRSTAPYDLTVLLTLNTQTVPACLYACCICTKSMHQQH